jgi:hypothetical protein
MAGKVVLASAVTRPRAASTQALVLTHELSKPEDYDGYLPRVLAPLRPVLSFGRSARAWPPAKANVAVYSWWRDPGSHGGAGRVSGAGSFGPRSGWVPGGPPVSLPPWS